MTSNTIQKVQILNMLIRAGADGITPMDALREAGVFRLAARVYDLRHDGHVIATAPQHYSGAVTVARYVLIRLAGSHPEPEPADQLALF